MVRQEDQSMRHTLHVVHFVPGVALAAEQSSTPSGPIDWELLLKALGFVVATVVAYVHWRGLHLTSRTSLKTDLEILKLLDTIDPNYHTVRAAVNQRVSQLYAPRPAQFQVRMLFRWAAAIFGLLWALGLSYWTVKLVQPGFTWWALLTGYLALAGVGWFFMGITGTAGIFRKLESRRDAVDDQKPQGT
jgi:hypothetical protein